MAKFKVGDRVRVVRIEKCDHAGIGQLGTVKEDSDLPWIHFDEQTGYGAEIPQLGIPEGFGDCLKEDQLELVSDKTDTAERDQLARDILIAQAESMGTTVMPYRYAEKVSLVFDLAEAFLAERAKRTTEN